MTAAQNPIALFQEWLADAKASSMREPTAMTLATATPDGKPSARIVLLKAVDNNGFVFYTNSLSRKGRELMHNERASLLFYWMELQKQVRVEGAVEQVPDAQSDKYFAERPYESQIGAWASQQSEVMYNREALLDRMNRYRMQFSGKDVPRPPHWGGFRVVPSRIEFWLEEKHRIHQRRLFTRSEEGWQMELLYP